MDVTARTYLAIGASAMFAAAVRAQALNIDCGGVLGTPPSDAYGAGAGQAGYWNPTSSSTSNLRDVLGNVTAASFGTSGGLGLHDIEGAMGDDARLMESVVLLDVFDLTGVFGLAVGRYDVYVYSWFPRDSGTRTVHFIARNGDGVTEVTGTTTFGVAWPGHQVEGETYAKLTIDVIEGRNFIGLSIFGGDGKFPTNDLNGIQIVPVPAPGVAALPLGLGAMALGRKRR